MRFRRLRTTLQRLAIASLPAARTLQGCCPPAPEPIHKVVQIDPADEVFAPLLDRCRTSDGDCIELCTKVLVRLDEPAEDVMFSECRISDVSSTRTDVTMSYTYPYECIAGRRPAGMDDPGTFAASSPLGAWLARTAALEAAAVYAFAGLGRDLAAAGAPAGLVRAALRAAGDEVRHAALTARLARVHGGQPRLPRVAARPVHDLAALAIDNAAEGCVRETFGALIATRQALAAGDPGVRAAMTAIAADETRHAALSAAIDRWAQPRLGEADRSRIADARAAATAELCAAPGGADHPELERLAGLPDPVTAAAMARALLAA